MAVAVSRDLTVQVLEDVNAVKLTDRQQALRAAIQRGEPKCLGVSQVMLGLMVMSYSIPLHVTDATEVVTLGVPWWTGLTFIVAGAVAIVLDKHCTMKTLRVCLLVSMVSTLLSVIALIIYFVDMDRNPDIVCTYGSCNQHHYAQKLSRGVKASLLIFTLAQTVISAILCCLLFKQRRSFEQYSTLSQGAPPTPITITPPDLN
ncbi:transmembrane protein 176 [Antennarius striatus]|uniref:transmembrane protein 176 n=1 Tax=Antennarius striatus TaxID=241820 RepID=UPI0035B08097